MEVRYYKDLYGNSPLTDWIDGLKDLRAKAQIRARVMRLSDGNLGHSKPLRDGVQELKIDIGPGYRVYLSRQGPVLVLLLCGGDKSDQSRDIERAIAFLNDWKQRGKP